MGVVIRCLIILLIPLLAAARDSWIEVRSGPFQVLSNAGDRPAREVLNQLEQVRYVVGQALGKEDLKTTWPFRIVVFKTGQAAVPALVRDTYAGALVAGVPPAPEWMRVCVRVLIESNAGRMPVGIESGIETFYSTAQVAGTKVTLGAPPPEGERNLDWARVHLLVTDPNYAGRLRVLLYNLQRGGDAGPAFRNAFAKTPEEVDKQASGALASGNFTTITVGGRPLSAQRDFMPLPVEGPLAEIALADLRHDYQGLLATAPAEAHEGLKEYAAAVEAGSKSARAWVEAARLNRDAAAARAQLQKAAELNPNWAEPYVVLASLETDPSRKLQWLKMAASLEPRSAERWRAVAEMYQTHNKYPEAARAWSAAENASTDGAERERMRAAREALEENRLAYEEAERKRQETERERDLRRVKDAALAEIRAAEERANRGQAAVDPNRKVEHMDIGEAASGKVRGKLVQADCLGRMVRLYVRPPEGKEVRLLVRDPQAVVVLRAQELTFQCGVQQTPREVSIEYTPGMDGKLGTAGEVVTVTYE